MRGVVLRRAQHDANSNACASVSLPPANVKLALRMRLANGSLSEAEVDAIAAILDEAANKLERT